MLIDIMKAAFGNSPKKAKCNEQPNIIYVYSMCAYIQCKCTYMIRERICLDSTVISCSTHLSDGTQTQRL